MKFPARVSCWASSLIGVGVGDVPVGNYTCQSLYLLDDNCVCARFVRLLLMVGKQRRRCDAGALAGKIRAFGKLAACVDVTDSGDFMFCLLEKKKRCWEALGYNF